MESDLALNDMPAAREHAGRAAALAPATGMAGARAAAGRAQALVALADCDAAHRESRTRRASRRAGVRVGRGGSRAPGTEGLAVLSPREREITELVAEGLTNRQIGARLFLSEKTIETHLTRVFQKLGLRSRAQVAAQVSRPD